MVDCTVNPVDVVHPLRSPLSKPSENTGAAPAGVLTDTSVLAAITPSRATARILRILSMIDPGP